MPDKPKPSDSYARRLKAETKGAAEAKAKAEAEHAAEPPTPFDPYTGRLQDALAPKTPDTPAAEPPVTPEPAPGPANLDVCDTGPVGQGDYVVRNGDCMESIAVKHGFFWESIWNDSNNSELRETRMNPNVLLADDRVTIREKERKEEPGETEQVHRFRRKGMPSKLRLRLMKEPESDDAVEEDTVDEESQQESQKEDEPRAGVKYILEIDGRSQTGAADAEGCIEINIPGDAKRGRLILEPGTLYEEEFPLQLGGLAPISEVSGVKQRLNNLGFVCGEDSERETEAFREALQCFKEQHGLASDDKLDESTRRKLQEIHGC